eukprot:jgi/Chlat1/8153/Chrsp76S07607
MASVNGGGGAGPGASQDETVPSITMPFSETLPAVGDARGKMTPMPAPAAAAAQPAAAASSQPFSYNLLGGNNNTGQPSFWKIARYQPYFNVDTVDVLNRIKDSLLPYKSDFLEKTEYNADLYGPFWICTTLIFTAAAISNYASYITHRTTDEPWSYDINKLVYAASIFYGYVGIIPIVLKFLIQYLGASVRFVSLWCLYGYSLFIFIPVTFVCILPSELARWVIVLAAWSVSSIFLVINFRHPLMQTGYAKYALILLGVAALHLGLGLALKLYFFNFIFKDVPVPAPAGPAPSPA